MSMLVEVKKAAIGVIVLRYVRQSNKVTLSQALRAYQTFLQEADLPPIEQWGVDGSTLPIYLAGVFRVPIQNAQALWQSAVKEALQLLTANTLKGTTPAPVIPLTVPKQPSLSTHLSKTRPDKGPTEEITFTDLVAAASESWAETGLGFDEQVDYATHATLPSAEQECLLKEARLAVENLPGALHDFVVKAKATMPAVPEPLKQDLQRLCDSAVNLLRCVQALPYP